jgi:gamma-D-glutamyl-L-lysine dipeptidyl-peptidase
MDHGISGLSIIPVRKEPSEKSEMVTQVLFGEHFQITGEKAGWSHVKLAWDNYEGWIDSKMITPISERAFIRIENRPFAVTGDIISQIPIYNGQSLMLVAGSTLPDWRPNLKQFTVNDQTYKAVGEVFFGSLKSPREILIKQALRYFNAPYFWGGRSPFGIDCSGFTQILYKMIGMRIPRDASTQVNQGVSLNFVEEALPGDLAFFDNEEGQVVHVGIIWKRSQIIHASGKVRIDNVDQSGIFNVDLKRYTHKLRVLKKMIGTNETD